MEKHRITSGLMSFVVNFFLLRMVKMYLQQYNWAQKHSETAWKHFRGCSRHLHSYCLKPWEMWESPLAWL